SGAPGAGLALDPRRRGRAGLRDRRLSRDQPRPAGTEGRRPACRDDRGRLWRGTGWNLQYPAADPRGSGEGRHMVRNPPSPRRRRIDRARSDAVLAVTPEPEHAPAPTETWPAPCFAVPAFVTMWVNEPC